MIIKVDIDEFEDIRIDAYLADYLEDYSRTKLSKLIKENKVLVNQKPIKPKYIVKENDIIELDLKDLEIKPIEAQDIVLDIIYEDDHIAIINKPIGMLTHPTTVIRDNTLVNALMYHFKELSMVNGEERAGIVHRLDFNTSGLMIIALSDDAGYKLKEMFSNRLVNKKYRAIVIGRLNNDEGIIETNISRSQRNRKLMEVSPIGKYAKTGYKVLKTNGAYSYLDLDLYTGRTHQLRVHLSHIKHPILGDRDYGGMTKQFSIDHQLLQSYSLEFSHPITKERLSFQIEESSDIKKYNEIIFKE